MAPRITDDSSEEEEERANEEADSDAEQNDGDSSDFDDGAGDGDSSDDGDAEFDPRYDGDSSSDEWQPARKSEPAAPAPKAAAKPATKPAAKPTKASGKASASAAYAIPLPTPKRADAAASADDPLLKSACRIGVVSTDREPEYEYAVLHPSKALRSAASEGRSIPIMKKPKSGAAKPKYLMALPGRLATVGAGDIGAIEKLDTANPELLLSFPNEGVLRLKGSLVRTRSRYLTLKPELRNKEDNTLLCEDEFDHVVVFSEAAWFAPSAEAAPPADGATDAEAPPALPVAETPIGAPDGVHKKIHKSFSYAGGAASEAHDGSAPAKPPKPAGGAEAAAAPAGNGADAGGSRSRAGRGVARKSYADKGSDPENDTEGESEEEEDLGELTRVKPGAPKRAATSPKKPAAPPPKKAAASASSGLAAFGFVKPKNEPKAEPKPPKAEKKPAAAKYSSQAWNDESSSDDAPPPKKAPPNPKPAAKPKKSAWSESEDEGDV